jgi:hypothetical protein
MFMQENLLIHFGKVTFMQNVNVLQVSLCILIIH